MVSAFALFCELNALSFSFQTTRAMIRLSFSELLTTFVVWTLAIPVETMRNEYATVLFSTSGDGPNSAHPEMAFERDGAGGGSSSIPKRNKKHLKRKKVRRTDLRRTAAPSGPLSEKDLGHHVASQYMTGRGGIFRVTDARRKHAESTICSDAIEPSHQDHQNYLKLLDRKPALVLNADYQPMSHLPLSLWCWQDVVKAVFCGKVTVVDVYPDVYVRAVNIDVQLPSVIALNDYVRKGNEQPAFTRRNVFLRDEYRCQYCSDHFHTNDLTLDHYYPRCMGGKLNWENAVTSCSKCNNRKGSLKPSEIRRVGMQLRQKPRVPTHFELAKVAGKMLPRRVHPTWIPYLGISYQPSTVRRSREEEDMFFEEA
eukprot:scaffold109541_cov50-Attheya_sp.AAC.6